MKLKKPAYLFSLSLLAGWIGEQLFWEQKMGVNILIFVALVLGLGFYFASSLALKPGKTNLWLLLPIAFFVVMLVIRKEPLTTFLNFWAALILLLIFGHSFLGERWWLYGFTNYIEEGLIMLFNLFKNAPVALAEKPVTEEKEETKWKRVQPYLKGLLFALPVVLFFTALLAAADPVFEEKAEVVLDWFIIDDLVELIPKGIFILMLSWGLVGAYLHAFNPKEKKKAETDNNPAETAKNKLGFIEANIILGSVNLLFLTFVFIQFRYFFGGESNINLTGYTYAEYARRGFGELVAVATFSLLLFMGLSAVAARETPRQERFFSGSGITLLTFVSIILVSAFQRLTLYETVYGFTRLRTYTHVFILWLGIYLAVVVFLEIRKKQAAFAFSLVLVVAAFVITLNVLNIDAFIVYKNIDHFDTISFKGDGGGRGWGEILDIGYLATLSEDAVPALERSLARAEDIETKNYIAGTLLCHAATHNQYALPRANQWPGFNLSQWRALTVWQAARGDDFTEIGAVQLQGDDWEWAVLIDGESVSCYPEYQEFD